MNIFSKRNGLIAALGVGLGLAVTAVAYATPTFGPSRPTFTMSNPAHYITFNSITDNPVWGDERYVVKARDASASTSTYSNSVNVTDGEELLVTTYFHNNAASNLNLVATNTRVRVTLPTGNASDQSITSYISADNANPTQVFATMDMTNASPFSLEYVPGSAQLKTNAGTFALSDNIVSGGVQVGSNGADGKVPGCLNYSGYAYFHVRVHKVTPPKPEYSCNLLTLTQDSSDIHKYNATVAYTAKNGASLTNVNWNWGDSKSDNTGTTTTASHTYAADGTFTVVSTLTFNVNGSSKTATSEGCSKSITISTPPVTPPQKPPKPTKLPNTGPGSVAGIFAGVSLLAGAAHYILSGRRVRG